MFGFQNIKNGVKHRHFLSRGNNVLLYPRKKSFQKEIKTTSVSQSFTVRSALPRPKFGVSKRHETTNAASAPTKNSKLNFWLKLLAVSAASLAGGTVLLSLESKRREAEEEKHQIKELVACGPTGGPKNLPIALHLTDEMDYEADKPKLVILGSGWGAVSVLKELKKDKYYVTAISPQSILEPIRSILRKIHGHFIEAKAIDIDFENKLVEVKRGDDSEKSFYVPYDKLVIAVGSQSMTYGVEGIEYCHFLKTIQDARKLRRTIMDNLEKAALPTTSSEERKKLLSFVVCGGGVEFAAELYDFLIEDLFPRALRNEVKVTIIQSQDHILNTYDAKISVFAEKKFKRDNINVITNARVSKIKEDYIVYKDKLTGQEIEQPYGLVLWSTGIAMNPLTKAISEKLPEQKNTRALITDGKLRLKGVNDSSVYAIGDCSTVENPNLVKQLMQFFIDADEDGSGSLDHGEFNQLAKKISVQYPVTESHLRKASNLFEKYDKDKSDTLELDELQEMFKDIDKKLTSLPATAQVAHQQGKYLGRKLNKFATKITAADGSSQDLENELPAFRYAHLGSLAYIGNAAVADFGTGRTWMGGLSAVYLWRSVYFSEQVSFRTRALLALDWTKRSIFGRDISKF
ncbi:1415_t:CDS:10 [Ambispora gerdemannii]|uniref:1415_t:CDS:1 n=1 Tax=Ambispora gerdemannii TaxID=144530 RepID=A0A9N9A0G8_9GLOM|nr:1415_t:CDS:10 [Ambispora gerdemannii]